MREIIKKIDVPPPLRNMPHFSNKKEITQWELSVAEFLSPYYSVFTPYEEYFRYRGNLFSMTRQLLPEYFNRQFDVLLEVGCGMGYHSLLLRPYAKKQIGVDIPGKYGDYVAKEFSSSPEMANFLVNTCFEQDVSFYEAYPDKLPMLGDNSVDFIFSWCLLEHIPNLTPPAKEWNRILKNGGIMLHIVPTVMNAIFQLLNANVIEKKDMVRKDIGDLSGRLLFNGCHSEFISTFKEQVDVYSCNNYAAPFLQNGFELIKLQPIRDFETALVFKKD